MDKINIENLFHCKTKLVSNSSNILDVNSIVHNNKSFNINDLIETREKKRILLLNNYIKYYDKCLKKIEIANNLDKTDLLYSVDEYILDCPEYKSIDCIKYIKNKLEQDFFDTYIINNNTLFITWLYLEVNREKNINQKYK